jgi:hypothetical protein
MQPCTARHGVGDARSYDQHETHRERNSENRDQGYRRVQRAAAFVVSTDLRRSTRELLSLNGIRKPSVCGTKFSTQVGRVKALVQRLAGGCGSCASKASIHRGASPSLLPRTQVMGKLTCPNSMTTTAPKTAIATKARTRTLLGHA